MLIIDRIVSQVGRRVDESSPMVDARLPDGSRINAIIPPLALDGPALSIRRFGKQALQHRRAGREEDASCPGSGRVPAHDRARAPQHPGLRRYRLGQNHDAQLHVAVRSRRRAHRDDRRLGRIDAAAAARGQARNAAGQCRGQGRSQPARPGQEQAADAARPHNRRRGPRRRSVRHVAGDVHRP